LVSILVAWDERVYLQGNTQVGQQASEAGSEDVVAEKVEIGVPMGGNGKLASGIVEEAEEVAYAEEVEVAHSAL